MKKKKYDHIIAQLPYAKPFCFVDEILTLNDEGITGSYTFQADADFYQGHFKDNPVTPGVLLTECCAQIGVVCLGIFLMDTSNSSGMKLALSSSEMEFYLPVYPDETVIVEASKEYFRFQKLKCNVKMTNSIGKTVCKGTIAGMIKEAKNG